MSTTDTYEGWIGRNAVDPQGDKIGVITDIYYDDATDQPEWITVKTGLLGTRSSFVPLHGADSDGENLRLPYDKAQVKDAPNIDTDGSLTPDEERTLYDHYGRGADLDTDRPTSVGDAAIDDAPTEEPEVGTGRREAGRARLRKHVATGQRTAAVPAAREDVDNEPEAVTGAEADGDDLPDRRDELGDTVREEHLEGADERR